MCSMCATPWSEMCDKHNHVNLLNNIYYYDSDPWFKLKQSALVRLLFCKLGACPNFDMNVGQTQLSGHSL